MPSLIGGSVALHKISALELPEYDAGFREHGPSRFREFERGVRVIPTFIAEVVLRVDLARTLWPDPGFFLQRALSQWF